jgi:hypothetical protein
MRKKILLAPALLILAGCATIWAQKGEHTMVIDAPATVNRGEKLTFTVTAKNAAGQTVEGIAYQWIVTWVGLEGIAHKGKTGSLEKINVKGAPGTAKLRIETLDAEKNPIVLATQEFKVE